jgi:hypothetical protein
MITMEAPMAPIRASTDQAAPEESKTVAVTAPPRCNFAGYCNFCGEQGCRSRVCVALYLETWWAACDICGGVGGDGLGLSCICTYGVIQVGSGWRGPAIQPH